MSRNLMLWLIAGLLVAGASVGLYFAEWKEVEVPGPPSEEARRNPYLAAERFLDTFDISFERHDGLSLFDDLPGTNALIIVGSSLRTASERRVDSLVRWVAEGGRLVVVANDFYSYGRQESGDPILDLLGLELHGEDGVDPDDDDEETDKADDDQDLQDALEELQLLGDRCLGGSRLTRVALEGEPVGHRIAQSRERYLLMPAESGYAAAGNEVGYQLVAAPYENGLVYVLTSLQLWRNDQIGCHDHAHFLRWLGEGRGGVHLVFSTEMPHITEIIWKRYSLAVCLVVVLLILLVWRGVDRRGLVLTEACPRRSLQEHIRGVSRFLWQQGDSAELLDALRRSVLAEFAHLSDDRRAERISELARASGLTEAQVQWAVEAESSKDVQAFKRQVRILTIIDRNK